MGGKSSKSKKASTADASKAAADAGVERITFDDGNGSSKPEVTTVADASKKQNKADKKKAAELEKRAAASAGDAAPATNGNGATNGTAPSGAPLSHKNSRNKRLTVDVSKNKAFEGMDLEEEERKKAKASKLFEAPKGPERSKIWKALNPDKLYYESRREKEEAADETFVVEVGRRNYAEVMRDEDGNVIASPDDDDDDEGEEEEDVDPENLPDFGEFQSEMEEMRRKRAEKEEQRRAELKRKWDEKKAAEKAALDAELKRIAEEEAKLAKLKEKEIGGETLVADAHKRLTEEAERFMKFEFKAE